MPASWNALVVGAVPESVRAALGGLGAATLAAADEQAVERLLGEKDIALVIAWCPAPTLLGIVHRDAGLRALPVIALVPSSIPGSRARLWEQGCDDVRDPDGPLDELLASVKQKLALRARVDGLLAEVRHLRELSTIDGLTQLYNHKAFVDRLSDEFRRAQRYDDSLALVMLDVDFFKTVNDTHGHLVGDEVLTRIAQALRKAVRETDFLARYGGEEFAVLLPRTNLAGALTVSERVHQDVHRLRLGPNQQLKVTVSLGVSAYPGRNVSSPEALVRTADEALYRSKREGRNKISLYQPPPSAPRPSGSP